MNGQLWGSGVKDQGLPRLERDLEAWRGIILDYDGGDGDDDGDDVCVKVIMLQNADVQRRLYERKSDEITHRLRDSEYSVTRYQVLSDVPSTRNKQRDDM